MAIDASSKQTILIFDLDRTITRQPTYTPFLIHAALRHAPWRLALLVALIPFFLAYAIGTLDRKGLKQVMQRMMLGERIARDTLTPLVESFADKIVPRGIYGQAQDMIREALFAGHRVIIATASHHFYVDPIAARLGVREVVATRSVWDGDMLTSDILGVNCYGIGKRALLLDYFVAEGIEPLSAHIRFSSDHISDLPVFDISDEPVATNPSTKLRTLAKTRGWPIVDW